MSFETDSERTMRTQTKSQIIGREGERWFHSVLPPEWSIQRPFDDFGSDGIVAIGTDKYVTPLEFGVQIKSSSQFKFRENKIIVPKIGKEHLYLWSSKFYPTLLVAYNSKTKKGYFEWISNLISKEELTKPQTYFYLHLATSRIVSKSCWKTIQSELEIFHFQISNAFRASKELLPIINTFASLLRNLCTSAMADRSNREGVVLYVMAQAWTHIEVVRQLDLLSSTIELGSMAHIILTRFREDYFNLCDKIFLEFDKAIQSGDTQWIMMKKPELSDPILQQLTAMLSDCVCGLLSVAMRKVS